MSRRTAVSILLIATLVGGITGCGSEQREKTPATATASPATEQAAPSATEQAAPATEFPVARRELKLSRGKDRPLETTIYHPGEGAGPFPLILFSHGLTAHPTDYGPLLEGWARAGFVVAAPAYPHTSYQVDDFDALDVANQPADASYVISQVLELTDREGDSLRGRIDRSRIAAGGHSAGGITTVGLFSGRRDERLRAGIVMAGRKVLPGAFTGPDAPILFVHGKNDATVPYADGLAAFRAVPWGKAMLAITDGVHVTTDRDFGLVATTTTDFWRWSLYGDETARDRLDDDATEGGLATFEDELN